MTRVKRMPYRRAQSSRHLPEEPTKKSIQVDVGIDFGTSTTAISWNDRKTTDTENEISIIANEPRATLKAEFQDLKRVSIWPGRSEDYVPTKSSYGSTYNWGCRAIRTIELPKLALQDSEETKSVKRRLETLGKEMDKKPSEFITDLLLEFIKWIKQSGGPIEKAMGKKAFRDSTLKYTFGVPANWSQSAVHKFVNAARAAGLSGINLVSEAEAATVAMVAMSNNLPLVRNDAFIVCDVGGGTVDLTTFILQCEHPLELKEAAVAEATMYGGNYLQDKLCELVFTKIMDEDLPSMHFIKMLVSKEIEEKKKSFGSEKVLPVWDLRVDGLEENREKGFLQGYAILLGGGMGQNKYLQRKLDNAFSNANKKSARIEVIRPSFLRTAVADGCVLLARNPGIIEERRSGYSYGVDVIEQYQRCRHHDRRYAQPLKDDYEDDETVLSVEWILPQGTPIRREKITRSTRGRYRTVEQGQEWIFYDFVYTSNKTNQQHLPIHHIPGQKMLYKIKVDMTSVPKSYFEFQAATTGKRAHYVIPYRIELTMEWIDGQVNLTFEVVAGPGDCIREKYETIMMEEENAHGEINSLCSRRDGEAAVRTILGTGLKDPGSDTTGTIMASGEKADMYSGDSSDSSSTSTEQGDIQQTERGNIQQRQQNHIINEATGTARGIISSPADELQTTPRVFSKTIDRISIQSNANRNKKRTLNERDVLDTNGKKANRARSERRWASFGRGYAKHKI
ncbi:MAG: hypothetical protein M1816_004508 [Peltula sp. TS41687]|nr:MAG: hypothetical protein M1816_004508 [Peltula sp. TS41687]